MRAQYSGKAVLRQVAALTWSATLIRKGRAITQRTYLMVSCFAVEVLTPRVNADMRLLAPLPDTALCQGYGRCSATSLWWEKFAVPPHDIT